MFTLTVPRDTYVARGNHDQGSEDQRIGHPVQAEIYQTVNADTDNRNQGREASGTNEALRYAEIRARAPYHYDNEPDNDCEPHYAATGQQL